MGAGASTAVNTTRTDISNEVYQKSDNVCRASCSNIAEDITIVIENSNVPGGITFTQACSAQALCTMRTNLDSVVNQNSVTNQNAEATVGIPLFTAGVATTINNSKTNIQNTTTQIINNVCEANVQNLLSDINILVSDSNVGFLAFDQEGSAVADCAIDATASSVVDQTSRTEQTATSTVGTDIFALIVLAIIVLGGGGIMAAANKKKDENDEKKKNLANQGIEMQQLS